MKIFFLFSHSPIKNLLPSTLKKSLCDFSHNGFVLGMMFWRKKILRRASLTFFLNYCIAIDICKSVFLQSSRSTWVWLFSPLWSIFQLVKSNSWKIRQDMHFRDLVIVDSFYTYWNCEKSWQCFATMVCNFLAHCKESFLCF